MSFSSFPFHEFLPNCISGNKDDDVKENDSLPPYFSLDDKFFRENVLLLSSNCISSKVLVKDLLKEFNKKFNFTSSKNKLDETQLLLAIDYFKFKKQDPKFQITFFQDTDTKVTKKSYFQGLELLLLKKNKEKFVIFKKSQKCNKCGLFQDLNKQGHCVYCRVDLQVKKKRKEHIVRDFLLEQEYGWKFYSADRVLNDAECGKERPDIVIDLGLVFLVLEIDEFQHEGYVQECERARVVNLFHALGCQKMLLVRFNPDKFVDKFYRKSKLDLLTRCEILHLFLKSLQENAKNPAIVETMETIQEFKLFFDYNPSNCYTSLDCFISKNVIVKNEILDLFQKV